MCDLNGIEISDVVVYGRTALAQPPLSDAQSTTPKFLLHVFLVRLLKSSIIIGYFVHLWLVSYTKRPLWP